MVIFIGIKQQKLTTNIVVYLNVNESHSEEEIPDHGLDVAGEVV